MLGAVCMDRFAQGLADPADANVVAECAWCGGEIYEGNEAYEVDLSALPRSRDPRKRLVTRESNLMHVRCWDECCVALDLDEEEAEAVAMLVIAEEEDPWAD